MPQSRLIPSALSLMLSVCLVAQQQPAQPPPAQQAPALPPFQVQRPNPATTAQPQTTPVQSTPAVTLPPFQSSRPAQNQAPAPAPVAPPASTPPTGAMQGTTAPQTPSPAPTVTFRELSLQNASLTEVIDMLARNLKLNYIIDPRVRGGVTLNTYGEIKALDQKALLDTILRINNAAMVQVGDIWRIVPMTDAARLPMEPQVDRKTIPNDDAVMLNLVFLKYASADELLNILKPFIGEGATMYSYPPANLLFILDSNRNMRRTMQLISLFDDQSMASQRVRAYELKNSRPSEFIKELEGVFKAISLSDKAAPIRFLALDRINTVIVIASNPAAFTEVERWIEKLDVPVKITAGTVDNYVYRVKYSNAQSLAQAIMSLYGIPGGSGSGYGGGGMGMGMGMGGYGGGGGMGYPGGGGYGNPYGGGAGAAGTGNFTPTYATVGPSVTGGTDPATAAAAAAGGGAAGAAIGAAGARGVNQTGSYLGDPNAMAMMAGMPRVIPRPEDNTILIQASPQQYASISKLLEQLDISPRQVLIEAKIYEVSLTGAFSSGISAYLQQRGTSTATTSNATLPTNALLGTLSGGALNLTAGFLVGQSRELLAFLQTQEATNRAKVVSNPKLITTDNIGASINVGSEVPTLTAQAVTGVQSGGTSLFANSVSNRNTGVTMNIVAHITPAGIVTMEIQQEVSAPIAPPAGAAIQSPSFSKRSIQTRVTVNDGDTIAVGGIILESVASQTAGIPLLSRLPYVGGVFGSKSYSRERTELVVFFTPHVIYDTNEIVEASDELKSQMRRVQRNIK